MRLYHYYDEETGPFRSLSDLPTAQAQAVLDAIRRRGQAFAARRDDGYLTRRRELEALVRRMFVDKGGVPVRQTPLYMVVEACEWLNGWYRRPRHVSIDASSFPPEVLSFTYGDLFPTFSDRSADGREYRGQVYTLGEIKELMDRHGLPQHWNADGRHGPERYIEVHVWDDCALRRLGIV